MSSLSANMGAKRGITHQPRDRGAEFVRSGRSNQKAVDPILNELCNAGGASGNNRHALVARLLKHVGHTLLVTIRCGLAGEREYIATCVGSEHLCGRLRTEPRAAICNAQTVGPPLEFFVQDAAANVLETQCSWAGSRASASRRSSWPFFCTQRLTDRMTTGFAGSEPSRRHSRIGGNGRCAKPKP